MRAMPGMTVLAPGDAAECAAMVRWATATPGPVYLRLGRDAGPDLFDADYRFEPGRVIRLREGTDVVLVGTGQQTARLLEAADLLAGRGSRRRCPPRPVGQAGRRGGPRRGGRRRPARRHRRGAQRPRRPRRPGGRDPLAAGLRAGWSGIGVDDTWGESAPNAWLLDRHGLTPARVADRVEREFEASRDERMTVEVAAMTGFSPKRPQRHRRRRARRRAHGPDPRAEPRGDPQRARGGGRRPGPRGGGDAAAPRRAPRGHPTTRSTAIHDPDVEAVVIVTPTSTHAALIEAALRAGKAVWSEKPIAQEHGRDRPDRRALARDRTSRSSSGFMRRFDPGYERAKRLIDAGELGRIEQFRALSRDTFPPSARVPAARAAARSWTCPPRSRPRALPRRGGGGGPRLGQRPVRRPLRAGRRLGHLA